MPLKRGIVPQNLEIPKIIFTCGPNFMSIFPIAHFIQILLSLTFMKSITVYFSMFLLSFFIDLPFYI